MLKHPNAPAHPRAPQLTARAHPRQTGRAFAGRRAGSGLLVFAALFFGAAPAPAAIPDGEYRQVCREGYRRGEVFRGEDAIYLETNFADRFCREESLEIRSYGRVEYDAEAKDLPPATEAVDFQFVKVTLTPKQEWVANLYRERKLCGRSDWKVGEESEITARTCDFFGLGRYFAVPEAGELRYGIYRMEKDGLLYFGKLSPERDGRSRDARPRELDPFPFVRR